MAAYSTGLDDVFSWMERHSIPEASRFTLRVAFEELVRNVMRHAYGEADPSREITVELREEGAVVTMAIQDDGPPFDPTAAPPPDTAAPIEDRSEGGLGIHLVRTMVSEMRYQRRGERNVVTVTVPRA